MIKQISIVNRSGHTLRGVLNLPDTCSDGSKVPVIMHLHGFGGNKCGYKNLHVQQARAIEKSGVAFVRFDFYGNGESDGEFEDMTFNSLMEDTEDIFQNVFLKYVLHSAAFESPEHEKAWIIRVTVNECKDLLKSFFRSRSVSLETVMEQAAPMQEDRREVLEAVLTLPQKYREVIYLHYYEGYTAPEISRILGKNVNSVYTLLTRSKKMLYEKLGGDQDAQ